MQVSQHFSPPSLPPSLSPSFPLSLSFSRPLPLSLPPSPPSLLLYIISFLHLCSHPFFSTIWTWKILKNIRPKFSSYSSQLFYDSKWYTSSNSLPHIFWSSLSWMFSALSTFTFSVEFLIFWSHVLVSHPPSLCEHPFSNTQVQFCIFPDGSWRVNRGVVPDGSSTIPPYSQGKNYTNHTTSAQKTCRLPLGLDSWTSTRRWCCN